MTGPASRKIALALAAMHPRDRRWMLGRLPPVARDAWRRHATEAIALVEPDPAAAMRHLSNSSAAPDVEVPEPVTLIRALDSLPVAWAARSLAVVAPDHGDLYRAACRADRQVAFQRAWVAPAETAPRALVHALAGLLQRLAANPHGLEGVRK